MQAMMNSYFDKQLCQIVIPEEQPLKSGLGDDDNNPDESKSEASYIELVQFSEDQIGEKEDEPVHEDVADFDLMKSRGELMRASKKIAPEELKKVEYSVSELIGNNIVERAPDKMLQVDNNYLLLAWRNDLIVFNLSGHGIIDEFPVEIHANFTEIHLKREDLQFLKLRHKYKIITLIDIGHDDTCMETAIVLEERKNRLIRYLKIDYTDRLDPETGEEVGRRMILSQLGVMVTKTKLSASPLWKYRSVSRVDVRTNKSYHVGIVVRQNGRWEVYSDFMLVYDWQDPNVQCVDVETDFNQFYLKFVTNSLEVIQNETSGIEKADENIVQFEVRQVRHYWRNRICFDTTKLKKKSYTWGIILHKRISWYFKLYSQILNYQIFMLISHRDMISVFKMTAAEG